MDVIEQLYRSLDERRTPGAVAALIVQAIGGMMMPAQRRVLERAAEDRPGRGMPDVLGRPVPAEHKVRTLVRLLGKDLSEETIAQMAGDPWVLLGQLQIVGPFVGWDPGADFKSRMTRQQRHEAGVDLSRRRYNRLIRQMNRTREQARRLQRQILLRQLEMVARSGLAYGITVDEMRADPVGACFVAYWVALRHRRRQFDRVAGLLLVQCAARADTDWWMVARAYPNPEVVARLSDLRQGEMIGCWFGFMRLAGQLLREEYDRWPTREIEPVVPDSMWADRPGLMPSRESRGGGTVKVVDLQTMVVQPGMDPSTWNTLAGAFNAARAGWLDCLAATGALDLLYVVCPGKVAELAAARAGTGRPGGTLPDPETLVWAALPRPWDVITGRAVACDVYAVEYECGVAGVDPHAAGWTAPRADGEGVWEPTPDLVQGVLVADPDWAELLRRAGVFSGEKAEEQLAEGGVV